MAYSGRLLLLGTVFLGLSCTVVLAEGESAGGTSSVTSSSDSGSTPNLGLGIFSRFPLNISMSVHGGYDDNVNTAPSGSEQSSLFSTVGLVVGYNLDSPRTKVSLASNFGFTYYSNVDSNAFEPNLNITLTLNHKVSPRLGISVSSFTVYQSEPDFQYGLGTNRRAGNYFSTQDKITASYAWAPRFSTATSYTIGVVYYDEIATGMFEDRVDNTFGNEFRFLIWPTTNLVGEYRFEALTYQHIDRDSTTHFLLAGFDHAFSPRLAAIFRGGAEVRHYQTVGTNTSPYFESTVTYVLGKDTSVAWSTSYRIEEGDIQFNPTRKSFRTGIQGRHNLTARISASLSMYFDHDDYAETESPNPIVGQPPIINAGFTEDSFFVDLALRYAVTRYMGLEAGYDHTEVSSGLMGRDYSRNRIWGGLNVSF
jgi:hypothetical protein